MAPRDHQNQPTLTEMASLLLEKIPPDKADDSGFKVIAYLAQRAADGEAKLASTKEVMLEIGTPKEKMQVQNNEASKAMANRWKRAKRAFETIEPLVKVEARRRGWSHYPDLDYQGGNSSGAKSNKPAMYGLKRVELGQAEYDNSVTAAKPTRDVPDAHGVIQYAADMELKLSKAGRAVTAIKWAKGLLIIVAICMLVLWLVAVVLSLATYVGATKAVSQLSLRDLLTVGVVFYLPWAIWRWMYGVADKLNQRVRAAPDWMVAWKEDNATIEMERHEGKKRFLVRRYTALCPACNGVIKLHDGGREYPRRVVARCANSPEEHVFSFDIETKSGRPMPLPGSVVEASRLGRSAVE